MNRFKCERCGNTFPMNGMFKASDRNFCGDCVEEALQDPDMPLEGAVERQIDPTVCAKCGYDNGSVALEKCAGMPVCHQCDDFLRHRPFPGWIKLSFAILIVVVVFSMLWNWRFIQGYQEMNASYKYLQIGDIKEASASMSDAARKIPESQDLHLLALYMEGRLLLWQNKPREALDKLSLCVNKLYPAYGVDEFILHARIGIAFESKDYDGYISCAKSLDQKHPNDFMSKATLASAYACKYAESDDRKYLDESLMFLDQSREMGGADPSFKEFEMRIKYRLHSKEVISREEYYKRFPNGWNGQLTP